jgi:hypothetical protein
LVVESKLLAWYCWLNLVKRGMIFFLKKDTSWRSLVWLYVQSQTA